jgi:hypothetical protein
VRCGKILPSERNDFAVEFETCGKPLPVRKSEPQIKVQGLMRPVSRG